MTRGVPLTAAAVLPVLPVLASVLPAVAAARPEPESAAPSWTERLEVLAPARRACLENAGPGACATGAEVLMDGMARMLVWLGEAGGRPLATPCHGQGPGQRGWDPQPQQSPPAPAEPAFFLERRCADARRIDAPDGRILGWLAYPACG